jgi:hypothetical protein
MTTSPKAPAQPEPGSFAFSLLPTEGFPGWLALADPAGPIHL